MWGQLLKPRKKSMTDEERAERDRQRKEEDRQWKIDERKRTPLVWPFLIDGDEYNATGTPAIYSTALRKWPQLNDVENKHKVADLMQEQGYDFWVACRMVFEQGSGVHICPKCGFEFGDA